VSPKPEQWLKFILAARFVTLSSPGQAQRFLSSFDLIRQHFHPKQHRLTATEYRQEIRQRFAIWSELTGIKTVA